MSRIIIGLTGPAGAGKNETAKILRRRGAYVIDADEAAHTLYKPQSQVWHGLVKAFGSRILMRGGKINRRKLGGIVFGDRKKLELLNKIVHPALKETIIRITGDQKAEIEKQKTGNRDQIIVINAAVLKEIGIIDSVDEVWVVSASRETRMKRLIRSGLSKAEAARRMKAQMSQASYLKLADRVIKNNGTKTELRKAVLATLSKLKGE